MTHDNALYSIINVFTCVTMNYFVLIFCIILQKKNVFGSIVNSSETVGIATNIISHNHMVLTLLMHHTIVIYCIDYSILL